MSDFDEESRDGPPLPPLPDCSFDNTVALRHVKRERERLQGICDDYHVLWSARRCYLAATGRVWLGSDDVPAILHATVMDLPTSDPFWKRKQ